MQMDTPEQRALLRQSMQPAWESETGKPSMSSAAFAHVLAAWRITMRVRSMNAMNFFRMDARERRRAVRGSHGLSVDTYRAVMDACGLDNMRSELHPRKQAHPVRRLFFTPPVFSDE